MSDAPQIHGSPGVVNQKHRPWRCNCRRCQEVRREYKARWARERRQGSLRTRPADEVRQHLLLLQRGGLAPSAVAKLAGLPPQTVLRIASGQTKRVRHETAEQILGVCLEDTPEEPHMLSSERALRWLEGMRDAGFTQRQIRAMLGYAPASTSIRLAPHGQITSRNHLRIRVTYKLLTRQGLVDATLLD